MTRALRFSVNHYLCPPTMRLEPFLDIVAGAGFTGVGLTQRALDELPLPSLRCELAARQLQVSSINSAGILLGESEDDQHDRNLRLVEATAELGANVLNVLPGHDAGLPVSDARAAIAAGLQSLAAVGQRAGIRLALEPLHAEHARIRSCINTIAAAAEVIDGSPAIALNLDMYHLWRDADLGRTTDGAGPPLGLVQICDIGSLTHRPHRLPLDEGEADWRAFLGQLQARQPRVPIELELFADQLPGRSAAQIIAAAARVLQ